MSGSLESHSGRRSFYNGLEHGLSVNFCPDTGYPMNFGVSYDILKDLSTLAGIFAR